MSIDSEQQILVVIGADNCCGKACIDYLIKNAPDRYHIRAALFEKEDQQKHVNAYESMSGRVEVFQNVNIEEPESLRNVFNGAHSAVIITPFELTRTFTNAAQCCSNMINMASASNVKYIVFVNSIKSIYRKKPAKMVEEKFLDCENQLTQLSKANELNWTILNAGFFMQDILFMCQSDSSTVNFPARMRTLMIDMRDVGQVAAKCLLTNDGEQHNEKTYELNGDAPVYDGESVTAELSKILKRPISLNQIEEAQFDEYYEMPLAELFRFVLSESIDLHLELKKQKEVEKLFGKPRSLQDFLRDHESDLNLRFKSSSSSSSSSAAHNEP
jgi:nucleoside-diphosphate-sugar epimerase